MEFTTLHKNYALNSMIPNTVSVRMTINYSIESFSEKYFGIVSKRSETDDSYYKTGTIVRVID